MPTLVVTREVIDTQNDVVSNGEESFSIMAPVEPFLNKAMIPN